MRFGNRGNWTLIGLLVAAAIVAVVFVVMWGGGGPSSVSKDSELLEGPSTRQTVPGRAIDKAKSVDCQERLRQIRAGISMYKISSPNESSPPTLKDALSNVSSSYFQCPVSNQPYSYDPAAGAVLCPTHPTY